MDPIDWTTIHGYDEWAQQLALLLEQAKAAPDAEARTAAEQTLTQFRERVPGYGADLNELAKKAIDALLLSDIGASLRELALLQQQLAGQLHGSFTLASYRAAPLGPQPDPRHALQEASSWLLPLVKHHAKHPAAGQPLRAHLTSLQQALISFLASYPTPPSAAKPARARPAASKKLPGK
ncbi:hypothetical protein A0257_13425 [Hymenobacter psoromatis]|nr:hypothetical protein A0257_13425 [Hymenobacter psoromatis]